MFKIFYQQLKFALYFFIVFTILLGIGYTGTITFIAQSFFKDKADGSLIKQGDKIIGSELIGQNFTSTRYFWGRPSATRPYPYYVLDARGSNLGPTNAKLIDLVKKRVEFVKNSDPENHHLIPVDLVTASGSGIDPDISPLAAVHQAHRVAKARGMRDKDILDLISLHTQPRQFGFLGEPRVNVLELNLALDALRKSAKSRT